MSAATQAVFVEPVDRRAVEEDLLATLEPLGLRGRVWIAALLGVCTLALAAWVVQLVYGLRVTAMRNYVSWGLYMTNFVFFIGISHAGTLISAILRVTNADWRRPITRMAEAITVFALMVGAPMVIIDMGRPDRLLNVITHGRFQSPILWDVASITTYLTGSMLYLYVAMIGDMPILAHRAREAGRPRWLVRLYEVLSLGYRGTPEQSRRLGLALGAMAVIIIPVAVSVHTVVSWVFGMTLRPGWHSTIFGPYFVIGAIFSGTAAIITAMALFRRAYRLERYLRPEHFRHLAKLLLALTLLYAYFTLSEYLTAWYGGLESDSRLLGLLAGRTPYGALFWGWAAFGLFVPIGLLLFPSRRSLGAIVTASVLINIGMWVKRYLIVVPTLQTPFIPAEAAGIAPRYFPSLVEWTIMAGAFAAFLLLFTLFSRIFPILSIWETAEDASVATVPEPGHTTTGHPRLVMTVVAALLAGGLAVLALPARAARPQQQAHVELRRTTEDGQDMLVAKVTVNGRAARGVTVGFFVQRWLGQLELGRDQTLEDGTAAVEFPRGLPGGARGELHVRAAVLNPENIAGVGVDVVLEGGAPARQADTGFPRALWAPRAPVGLLGTLAFLLLCVWLTYAFAFGQLLKIYSLGKER
jgi:molybdopterin-containing oxidoreductase family membrane subunit